MIVLAVVDDALSPDFPLGVDLEVFIRREDAERFIEERATTSPISRAPADRGARARGGRAELGRGSASLPGVWDHPRRPIDRKEARWLR
jgi:hypothetical protein